MVHGVRCTVEGVRAESRVESRESLDCFLLVPIISYYVSSSLVVSMNKKERETQLLTRPVPLGVAIFTVAYDFQE